MSSAARSQSAEKSRAFGFRKVGRFGLVWPNPCAAGGKEPPLTLRLRPGAREGLALPGTVKELSTD